MIKDKIKQTILETFKLLWQFKWYISVYLLWWSISFVEIFNPPAKNDHILNYEYTRGAWNYINQEVYVHSMKLWCVIDGLIFLIATSNMRNHPLLAKCIFLYPFIGMSLGLLVITIKWMLNLF